MSNNDDSTSCSGYQTAGASSPRIYEEWSPDQLRAAWVTAEARAEAVAAAGLPERPKLSPYRRWWLFNCNGCSWRNAEAGTYGRFPLCQKVAAIESGSAGADAEAQVASCELCPFRRDLAQQHWSDVKKPRRLRADRELWLKNFIKKGSPAVQSGVFTYGEVKLISAMLRAAQPGLDRSTYLETDHHGLPVYRVGLLPGGVQVSGNSGPSGCKVGGGKRGKVRGKSRQSRRRQMMLMAQVRPVGAVYFLTLTLSDEVLQAAGDTQTVLALLKGSSGWLERFKKAFLERWPGGVVLWGEELEDRKSGQFRGALMPHFHMIVFNTNPASLETSDEWLHESDLKKSDAALRLQGWAKRTWAAIVGTGGEGHQRRGADVQDLDSRRKIFSYVTKYTGKEQTRPVCPVTGEVLDTGRMWGMWNKEAAGELLCEPIEIIVSGLGLVELKRLLKRWLKARGKSGQRYGRWLVTNSTGKRFVIFGMGIDDVAGGLNGDKVRGVVRWWNLIEQCEELAIDKKSTASSAT